jgi:hypothetical protein
MVARQLVTLCSCGFDSRGPRFTIWADGPSGGNLLTTTFCKVHAEARTVQPMSVVASPVAQLVEHRVEPGVLGSSPSRMIFAVCVPQRQRERSEMPCSEGSNPSADTCSHGCSTSKVLGSPAKRCALQGVWIVSTDFRLSRRVAETPGTTGPRNGGCDVWKVALNGRELVLKTRLG